MDLACKPRLSVSVRCTANSSATSSSFYAHFSELSSLTISVWDSSNTHFLSRFSPHAQVFAGRPSRLICLSRTSPQAQFSPKSEQISFFLVASLLEAWRNWVIMAVRGCTFSSANPEGPASLKSYVFVKRAGKWFNFTCRQSSDQASSGYF